MTQPQLQANRAGYMQVICGQCKEPMVLTGHQINFMSVCESCYENYQITHNPLSCPYKVPKRRKLLPQIEFPTVTTTQAQTIDIHEHYHNESLEV